MRSNGTILRHSNLFDASLLNFSRLKIEAAFFVINAIRHLTPRGGLGYISPRIY